jgi:hypothetical protein
MSQSEETKRLSGGPEAGRTAKRPYHKPAVRYERVFETRALQCGKVETTQFSCEHNRNVS